jgi:hypothetical protein
MVKTFLHKQEHAIKVSIIEAFKWYAKMTACLDVDNSFVPQCARMGRFLERLAALPRGAR